MTKTEQLRAALLHRGFAVVEHVSSRECVKGPGAGGTIHIWLDRVGGGVWHHTPRKSAAKPLSSKTVELVLAGQPSKVVG